jgi:hypothetical protein
MKARALLGLGLFTVACASGAGDDGSAGTSGLPIGSTGGEEQMSTGEETPTTGEPGTTGVAETTGTSTSSDGTTTIDETTGGGSTGEASSSTGEPFDPCPRVRVTVTPPDTLNVRPTPSTEMAPVGALASGVIVDVLAIVEGEEINGTNTWYEIDGPNVTGFVFGEFVECTQDEVPDDGFFLPLECGKMATISQGNNGDFSHVDDSAYAFDFALALGTPLVAIEAGTVSHLFAGTLPGDPCYDGGGQECIGKANFVTLQHADGTSSIYFHLNEVTVQVEQVVARGTVVGLSGSSGWSTGPHAHVARQESCGLAYCQSIPVTFADVPDDGVPETGDVVTSQNCPE